MPKNIYSPREFGEKLAEMQALNAYSRWGGLTGGRMSSNVEDLRDSTGGVTEPALPPLKPQYPHSQEQVQNAYARARNASWPQNQKWWPWSAWRAPQNMDAANRQADRDHMSAVKQYPQQFENWSQALDANNAIAEYSFGDPAAIEALRLRKLQGILRPATPHAAAVDNYVANILPGESGAKPADIANETANVVKRYGSALAAPTPLAAPKQPPGMLKTQSVREFGEKVALSLSQYLPDRDTALRQMAVTGLLSSAISGGRSYLDPGYDEKFDDEGRIISRKRRNPTTSALRSAGIGLGMGALSSLASQVGNNWAKDQGFWRPKT